MGKNFRGDVFDSHCICFQVCNKPQKVERDHYDGPAMDIDMSAVNLAAGKDSEENGKTPERSGGDIHHRPPTRSGGRNMQESSFAFSGNLLSYIYSVDEIVIRYDFHCVKMSKLIDLLMTKCTWFTALELFQSVTAGNTNSNSDTDTLLLLRVMPSLHLGIVGSELLTVQGL